jgi:hypothetical protein
MTVRNLALSSQTWDVPIVNGNLGLVSDNAAIVQAANSALRMILGEWFLDPTQGVPYVQLFQRKGTPLALIKQTLTDTLLAVKGITRVTQLDMRYVSTTRQLTVAWTAVGDSNQLVSSQIGVF